MADYKNQHFVPRCYLKRFSLNAEGRCINVYNVKRRQVYRNAPVKNQCSGNYFYGKDLRLEKLLQKEEKLYDNIINTILQEHNETNSIYENNLRRFSYLQYCRTEYAARRFAQAMHDMITIAREKNKTFDWKAFRQEAIIESMTLFAGTIDMIDDLQVCLARNVTDRPFITSDDPAVLTNRWYAQKSLARGKSGGIASAGAILLLPISPRCVVIIYDGGVYKIHKQSGWATVHKYDDIDAFNQLQILNCSTNIYFSDWRYLNYISEQTENNIAFRLPERHKINTAVLVKKTATEKIYRTVSRDELTGHSEILVHVQNITPSPSRWPSIINWSVRPKVFSNGSGEGFIRRAQAEREVGYWNVC